MNNLLEGDMQSASRTRFRAEFRNYDGGAWYSLGSPFMTVKACEKRINKSHPQIYGGCERKYRIVKIETTETDLGLYQPESEVGK